MCVLLKPSSVNLHNMDVLPTPESPSMRSLIRTSYCFAILTKGVLVLFHSMIKQFSHG